MLRLIAVLIGCLAVLQAQAQWCACMNSTESTAAMQFGGGDDERKLSAAYTLGAEVVGCEGNLQLQVLQNEPLTIKVHIGRECFLSKGDYRLLIASQKPIKAKWKLVGRAGVIDFGVERESKRLPNPGGGGYQHKLILGSISSLEAEMLKKYPGKEESYSLEITAQTEAGTFFNINAQEELNVLPGQKAPDKFLVDVFGQRIEGNWPGKAKQIKRVKAVPSRYELPKMLLNRQIDLFPGKGAPHFRLKEYKGRWLLHHDSIGVIWSLGVTGVRLAQVRLATSHIGKAQRPFYAGLSDSGFVSKKDSAYSHYLLNTRRKYKNKDAWIDATLHRLKSSGLNTIGAWSDTALCAREALPYTWSMKSNDLQGLRLENGMPDVYNPRWKTAMDSVVKVNTAPRKFSPNLIGYFVDNELKWHSAFPIGMGESYTMTEFINFVRERYLYEDELVRAWQGAVPRFEQIKDMAHPDSSNTAFWEDLHLFQGRYAERYFSTVSDLLRKHDPNHLYLGCRFVKRMPDAAITGVAAKYCNVISVNIYEPKPAQVLNRWYAAVKKPIIIGEFHFPLASERQVLPPYKAFTEQERNTMVAEYIAECKSLPFVIGAHWYQYVDQPLLGRMDGERQTVGLVDVTDTMYESLVNALGGKPYLKTGAKK